MSSSPSPPPGTNIVSFPLACVAVATFRADKRKNDSVGVSTSSSGVGSAEQKQLSCRKGDAIRVLARAGESRTWVLCENLRSNRRGILPLCFLSCDRLLDSSQRTFVFFRVRAIVDSDASTVSTETRTPLTFKEGECFTVVATRTHRQFIWKGRHKNVVGLFAADQVVEIDEGGSVVAPTPIAGSWQSAFETISSSQSDFDATSSPLHMSSVSPRRGRSVPGEFRPPPMARSQSQILQSDGSAMSTASLNSMALASTRTRRRGATTTGGGGGRSSSPKFRAESDASSRPHSLDLDESDNSVFFSPRDGGGAMYISPRGGGSSMGVDSVDDSEPCAASSGVFAGEVSESSMRLLIVVRNRLGAPAECAVDDKLAVTLTRAGPPRHIKKLTPLLTDQPSTYVVEVERGGGGGGAVIDVKLDNVAVNGSPMTI